MCSKNALLETEKLKGFLGLDEETRFRIHQQGGLARAAQRRQQIEREGRKHEREILHILEVKHFTAFAWFEVHGTGYAACLCEPKALYERLPKVSYVPLLQELRRLVNEGKVLRYLWREVRLKPLRVITKAKYCTAAANVEQILTEYREHWKSTLIKLTDKKPAEKDLHLLLQVFETRRTPVDPSKSVANILERVKDPKKTSVNRLLRSTGYA